MASRRRTCTSKRRGRLGVSPDRCAAVEDSHGGIRSAHAAGMRVVAIPNSSYPPDADALTHADVVIGSLAELTPDVVCGSASRRRGS